MEKIRVMVVDDSRISCTMLTDLLSRTNFEVCATARNAKSAIELYKRHRPQIVTMDMNLPDQNGIECSRKIRQIDGDARIVMISAMRDDMLIKQGKAAGIAEFLQKPVRINQLLEALTKLCAKKIDNTATYRDIYAKAFSNALHDTIYGFTGHDCVVTTDQVEDIALDVSGVAVISGLTGQPSGRVIVHMDARAMIQFATAFLNRSKSVDDMTGLETVEEATNIIVGRAASLINDEVREREIRITPPGAVVGNRVRIAGGEFYCFRIKALTPYGEINLELGLAKGE